MVVHVLFVFIRFSQHFYVLLIINLINKRSFILNAFTRERSKYFLFWILCPLFGFGFGTRASCCLDWVGAHFPAENDWLWTDAPAFTFLQMWFVVFKLPSLPCACLPFHIWSWSCSSTDYRHCSLCCDLWSRHFLFYQRAGCEVARAPWNWGSKSGIISVFCYIWPCLQCVYAILHALD